MTKKQKLIQLIHIGKNRLHLGNENYRALLEGVTGKSSCKDMTIKDLEAVLKAMKSLGFKVKKMPVKKSDVGARATPGQIDYIKGLWELASREKTERSLARFIKRIAGVDALRFMTKKQATKIILALREMAAKAGYDPDGIPLTEEGEEA